MKNCCRRSANHKQGSCFCCSGNMRLLVSIPSGTDGADGAGDAGNTNHSIIIMQQKPQCMRATPTTQTTATAPTPAPDRPLPPLGQIREENCFARRKCEQKSVACAAKRSGRGKKKHKNNQQTQRQTAKSNATKTTAQFGALRFPSLRRCGGAVGSEKKH